MPRIVDSADSECAIEWHCTVRRRHCLTRDGRRKFLRPGGAQHCLAVFESAADNMIGITANLKCQTNDPSDLFDQEVNIDECDFLLSRYSC
jgi:hypothetical protein